MTPYYSDDWLTVWAGDCRTVLAELPVESVHCVVTSPPYWGLRSYGIPPSVWGGDAEHEHVWDAATKQAGGTYTGKNRWQHDVNGRGEEQPGERRQELGIVDGHPNVSAGSFCLCGAWLGDLGLEPTPEQYVANLVEVCREVRRVLRSDGTVWLNLGDSYATGAGSYRNPGSDVAPIDHGGKQAYTKDYARAQPNRMPIPGLKPKDRVMIPARVALALQADGWWLRDEIIWHKANPMPSSVRDRTTPAHEMVYLLTKSARYAYDADAIAEQAVGTNHHDSTGMGLAAPGQTAQRGNRQKVPGGWDIEPGAHSTIHRNGRTSATYREAQLSGNVSASTERQRVGINARWDAKEDVGATPLTRNKRSVWTVAAQPYPEAHFATFPQKLIEPMILAGCPEGGTVLDPFAGSGTTGLVAQSLSRRAVLIDLNPDYLIQAMGRNRDIPLGLAR